MIFKQSNDADRPGNTPPVELKWPKGCEHCGTVFDDEDGLDTWNDGEGVVRCSHCRGAVAVSCPACGGEGFVEEAEWEADWVNYSDEAIITCPECQGARYVADPSFG